MSYQLSSSKVAFVPHVANDRATATFDVNGKVSETWSNGTTTIFSNIDKATARDLGLALLAWAAEGV
jgi:hypothetical protein